MEPTDRADNPIDAAFARLSGSLSGAVLCSQRMGRHTALRVGGPAALHVTCDTYADLRLTCTVLAEEGVPWVIMGKGSGVVVSDAGYVGAVISLGGEFRRISIDGCMRLHAGAGVALQRAVTDAYKGGLSGLEFAAGIPGTVGGAVSMNAALDDRWIGRVVDEVVAFRPGHGLVRYAGTDVNWYRRCCDIPSREIILEASFCLEAGDAAAAKRSTEGALERRRACAPLDAPACGPLFADVDGRGASAIIGACGLAGYTCGGARVDPRNPNYVLNVGGASSTDVVGAISHVLEEVRARHGIELRPEVKFLGFAS